MLGKSLFPQLERLHRQGWAMDSCLVELIVDETSDLVDDDESGSVFDCCLWIEEMWIFNSLMDENRARHSFR